MDYINLDKVLMQKNAEIIRLKDKLNYLEESHLNILIDLQDTVDKLTQENAYLHKQNKYIKAYSNKLEQANTMLIKQLDKLNKH